MNVHKHALTYSMSAVLAAIFIALACYVADLPSWVNFAAILVLFFLIVIGLKNWRDKYNNGHISYGKAMGYSTFFVLYFCIAMAIWTYIFYTYIAPDLLDKMRDEEVLNAINRLKKFKVPEDQWESSLNITKKMFKPWIQSIMALFGGMFFYTIANLIISAILKKDAPQAIDNTNNSQTV